MEIDFQLGGRWSASSTSTCSTMTDLRSIKAVLELDLAA
jgi:hypothetical protein